MRHALRQRAVCRIAASLAKLRCILRCALTRATGLNNPRGIKFGPDGDLYVAERSTGGPLTTTAQDCPQVVPPVGPYSGRQGRMYVLENTTGNPGPTPGTGRIVRVGANNALTVIASGLALPTAMTFGPGDDPFVSNLGFGPPPVGLGSILRVEVPD